MFLFHVLKFSDFLNYNYIKKTFSKFFFQTFDHYNVEFVNEAENVFYFLVCIETNTVIDLLTVTFPIETS